MPELLTMQDLANGHLDVKALGEAANGDENTIVTTRTGNTYPSAERAINIMFQNGGLPAKPFATKAKMTTEGASLADGQLAQVYNETANNGLYVKTAGVWVRSKYDLADIAKKTIAEIASINPAQQDVVVQLDSNKNLVYRIDSDGEYFIPNLERSIQGELTYLRDRQSNENSEARGDSKSNKQVASKHSIAQPYLERLQNARAHSRNIAPVPHLSAPQRYTIGNSWINSVTVATNLPADKVEMSGYIPQFAENIGVVHPQIWEFTEKVAGYKYWLGLNPYTAANEDIELPFIYGSNDPTFKTWQLIESFPQPFEPDPIDENGSYRGFLSDSGFVYDFKLGDFIFFWRKTLYYNNGINAAAETAFEAARYNGVNWSENYYIKNPASIEGDFVLSPNIIYNAADDLYYMYTVYSGTLFYRTSPDLQRGDLWSSPTACGFGGSLAKPWHFDIKFIGNKIVALLHIDNDRSVDNTDAFYFAVSDDFINFTVSNQSIVTTPNPELYKATFIPEFLDNGNTRFKILYTTDTQKNPKFQFYVSTTNEVNLGV